MIKLTSTFELTTPAFMGGADHEAAHFRLTEFKSALRWWWRALNWSKFHSGASVPQAIEAMWHREMELFGSAGRQDEDGASGGQGRFLMRTVAGTDNSSLAAWDERTKKDWTPGRGRPGLTYLLGQGLWERGSFTRNALAPGSVAVEILFKPTSPHRTDAQIRMDMEEVCQAIWLLGHFGGVGARSRRGFGSLSLTSLTGSQSVTGALELPKPARYASEIEEQMNRWLPPALKKESPPITAFSKLTRAVAIYGVGTAPEIMESAGAAFKVFRSPSGLRHPDVDLVRQFASGGAPSEAPARAVFGLGHNYFLTGKDRDGKALPSRTVTITPGNKAAEAGEPNVSDRRASPLLMHLHEWPDGRHSMMHCLIPAKFLPPEVRLQYSEPKNPRTHQVPVRTNVWSLADEYMSTLAKDSMAESVFSRNKETQK